MKKVFFITILALSGLFVNAQTNLDSLYSIWQDQTQTDSTRTKAYNDYISNGYLYSNPDSAFALAEDLQGYAEKHKYPKASGYGYKLQGIVYKIQGNYPLALEYFEKSLRISEKIEDKHGIAISLNNIGMIYETQSNYPEALNYYEQSLKIREEIGDKRGIAGSLNNIGIISKTQGNYPEALNYYEQSLKISEESGNKKGVATSLTSIGNIYTKQDNFPEALNYYERSLKIREEIGHKHQIASALNNIGIIYQRLDNCPEALNYYERSLKIREEIGDKKGIASSLFSIGIIYKIGGNYSEALNYNEQSLKIREEIGDKPGIVINLLNLGNLFKNQGKTTLALNYYKRCLVLAEEIGLLERQHNASECLYYTYKEMGKGNEALVYLEKMRVAEYSLNAEETSKKLQQMEFQKEILADSIAKAEEARIVEDAHQEEVRQGEKTRNIALGGGLMLLILAVGLYGRVRYIRKSKALLQIEKDRSENLLLNILPVDIAAELKEKGRADARDFDMVSILFTDFKGFTEASAKLSAQDLVSEINTCFEAFDGIMAKYGVEKIKTIGDAYLAAGGLPVPVHDSTKNTVLAALEMQAFISQRKAEMDVAGKSAFEMRVGVHTGPVVAGIVGVKKFQYDIWGDTVNIASRIESSGEVGKVNISQATYELLKDDQDFKFLNRGKIEAKGKGDVEMYFVSKV